MREWRCPCCQRLLFRGAIVRVQVKCPRCRSLTVLEAPAEPATSTVKSVVIPLRPGKERVAVNG
ncbi:hypothetical protein NNJEOMEG_00036 [Fundidesulfovibrio magnetotacticus]|uniref:Com family DNA-binding transcriptional regulator n=1 Tax=Fundidesulfovibrio magnetotacticus TaxID=2730080 RepID=A0A6V8LKK6_9BACT|nr:Com family DNA-binding transcriptional regulator [Fundidesulfovibrio magnetotacticus]GFK92214.1 hypothetical protein NNJEOMEG_00036 [Fundidesulfovibrio magnetotacticus]